MDIFFPFNEGARREFEESARKLGFDELAVECTASLHLLEPSDKLSVVTMAWKKVGDYLNVNPFVPYIDGVVRWIAKFTLDLWFGRDWIGSLLENKSLLVDYMMKIYPIAYSTVRPLSWNYMFSIYNDPWMVDYLNVNFKRINSLDQIHSLDISDSIFIAQEGIALINLRMIHMFDFQMVKFVKFLCQQVLLVWQDRSSSAYTTLHETPDAMECIECTWHIYLIAICESDGARNLHYVLESIQRNQQTNPTTMNSLERAANIISKAMRFSSKNLLQFINKFLLRITERRMDNYFGVSVEKYIVYLTEYQLRKLHSLDPKISFEPHLEAHKRLMKMYVKQRERSEELMKMTPMSSEHLFSGVLHLDILKSAYGEVRNQNRAEWHKAKVILLLAIISEELNVLEQYKCLSNGSVDDMIEKERNLAIYYSDLAKCFSKMPYLEQEACLTAFSLCPCKEHFDFVIRCGSRNLRAIKKQMAKFENVTKPSNGTDSNCAAVIMPTEAKPEMNPPKPENGNANIFSEKRDVEKGEPKKLFPIPTAILGKPLPKRPGRKPNPNKEWTPKDLCDVIYAAATGASDSISNCTEEAIKYPTFALMNSVTDTEDLVRYTDYDDKINQYGELNRIMSSLQGCISSVDDILTLLMSPRYKRLTWTISWKMLKKRCRILFTKDKRKRELVEQYMADANDRLKYLVIDYEQYKDKPQIDYGSIEDGYECYDTDSDDDNLTSNAPSIVDPKDNIQQSPSNHVDNDVSNNVQTHLPAFPTLESRPPEWTPSLRDMILLNSNLSHSSPCALQDPNPPPTNELTRIFNNPPQVVQPSYKFPQLSSYNYGLELLEQFKKEVEANLAKTNQLPTSPSDVVQNESKSSSDYCDQHFVPNENFEQPNLDFHIPPNCNIREPDMLSQPNMLPQSNEMCPIEPEQSIGVCFDDIINPDTSLNLLTQQNLNILQDVPHDIPNVRKSVSNQPEDLTVPKIHEKADPQFLEQTINKITINDDEQTLIEETESNQDNSCSVYSFTPSYKEEALEALNDLNAMFSNDETLKNEIQSGEISDDSDSITYQSKNNRCILNQTSPESLVKFPYSNEEETPTLYPLGGSSAEKRNLMKIVQPDITVTSNSLSNIIRRATRNSRIEISSLISLNSAMENSPTFEQLLLISSEYTKSNQSHLNCPKSINRTKGPHRRKSKAIHLRDQPKHKAPFNNLTKLFLGKRYSSNLQNATTALSEPTDQDNQQDEHELYSEPSTSQKEEDLFDLPISFLDSEPDLDVPDAKENCLEKENLDDILTTPTATSPIEFLENRDLLDADLSAITLNSNPVATVSLEDNSKMYEFFSDSESSQGTYDDILHNTDKVFNNNLLNPHLKTYKKSTTKHWNTYQSATKTKKWLHYSTVTDDFMQLPESSANLDNDENSTDEPQPTTSRAAVERLNERKLQQDLEMNQSSQQSMRISLPLDSIRHSFPLSPVASGDSQIIDESIVPPAAPVTPLCNSPFCISTSTTPVEADNSLDNASSTRSPKSPALSSGSSMNSPIRKRPSISEITLSDTDSEIECTMFSKSKEVRKIAPPGEPVPRARCVKYSPSHVIEISDTESDTAEIDERIEILHTFATHTRGWYGAAADILQHIIDNSNDTQPIKQTITELKDVLLEAKAKLKDLPPKLAATPSMIEQITTKSNYYLFNLAYMREREKFIEEQNFPVSRSSRKTESATVLALRLDAAPDVGKIISAVQGEQIMNNLQISVQSVLSEPLIVKSGLASALMRNIAKITISGVVIENNPNVSVSDTENSNQTSRSRSQICKALENYTRSRRASNSPTLYSPTLSKRKIADECLEESIPVPQWYKEAKNQKNVTKVAGRKKVKRPSTDAEPIKTPKKRVSRRAPTIASTEMKLRNHSSKLSARENTEQREISTRSLRRGHLRNYSEDEPTNIYECATVVSINDEEEDDRDSTTPKTVKPMKLRCIRRRAYLQDYSPETVSSESPVTQNSPTHNLVDEQPEYVEIDHTPVDPDEAALKKYNILPCQVILHGLTVEEAKMCRKPNVRLTYIRVEKYLKNIPAAPRVGKQKLITKRKRGRPRTVPKARFNRPVGEMADNRVEQCQSRQSATSGDSRDEQVQYKLERSLDKETKVLLRVQKNLPPPPMFIKEKAQIKSIGRKKKDKAKKQKNHEKRSTSNDRDYPRRQHQFATEHLLEDNSISEEEREPSPKIRVLRPTTTSRTRAANYSGISLDSFTTPANKQYHHRQQQIPVVHFYGDNAMSDEKRERNPNVRVLRPTTATRTRAANNSGVSVEPSDAPAGTTINLRSSSRLRSNGSNTAAANSAPVDPSQSSAFIRIPPLRSTTQIVNQLMELVQRNGQQLLTPEPMASRSMSPPRTRNQCRYNSTRFHRRQMCSSPYLAQDSFVRRLSVAAGHETNANIEEKGVHLHVHVHT